jgi:peroxiredoxin Q/BCP
MRLNRLAFIGLLLSTGLFAQAPAAKTHLKIGDPAPDFTLPSTKGDTMKLSDFRGKKSVVLAFFPAAFTGGCSKEMAAYETGIANFQQSGAEVFAISTDNLPTLKFWSQEHLKSSFPMLSDFMRKVSASYGVLNAERGIANRTTFVVDADGNIQHIDEGAAAIDVSGAATACSRLKRK